MPFEWVPTFLTALAASPNVTAAASAAGVSRASAYERRQLDLEFAAAWDDALAMSTDTLVGEMYRRAVEGTVEEVYHKGEVCGTQRRYSDTLAMFLARAHRPELYGDKSRVDLTTDGERINTVFYLPLNGRDDDTPIDPDH